MQSVDWTASRVASVVWAVAMVAVCYRWRGGHGAYIVLQASIWPLACIWLSDHLGYSSGIRITRPVGGPTPGVLFTAMEWIMMLVITAVLIAEAWRQRRERNSQRKDLV